MHYSALKQIEPETKQNRKRAFHMSNKIPTPTKDVLAAPCFASVVGWRHTLRTKSSTLSKLFVINTADASHIALLLVSTFNLSTKTFRRQASYRSTGSSPWPCNLYTTPLCGMLWAMTHGQESKSLNILPLIGFFAEYPCSGDCLWTDKILRLPS